MRNLIVPCFVVGGILTAVFIGYDQHQGTGFTVFLAITGAVIFGFMGKIYAIAMTPGKTDPTTMTEDEKKTHDFEKENLKGFSGGFFGQTAIMITNLIAATTKKPGYQQHPELFALVYGIITLGVGFFRYSVVQDLLNSAGNVSSDNSSTKEVCDVDDD